MIRPTILPYLILPLKLSPPYIATDLGAIQMILTFWKESFSLKLQIKYIEVHRK